MKIRFLKKNALSLFLLLLSLSLQAQDIQIKIVPIDASSRDSLNSINEKLYDYAMRNKLSMYDARLDSPVTNDSVKMELARIKGTMTVQTDPYDPYSSKDSVVNEKFSAPLIDGYFVWFDPQKPYLVAAISPYYWLSGQWVPQATFWIEGSELEKYSSQFTFLKKFLRKHL